MNAPAPATVPQRLWRDIEVAPLGGLKAEARVSVLLDGDPAGRGRTVDALAGQSYPTDLVDVVEPGSGLEPDGDVVVLLAAGAVPAPGFIEAHARWHHVVADAVTFGALVPEESGTEGDPLGVVRDLTRDLTDLIGGYHLAAAEGTMAVCRELFLDAGGTGSARAEVRRLDLAHRLHCAGALFVAEPEALARGDAPGLALAVAMASDTGETLELDWPATAALVALPPFREPGSARRHARPAVAVNLQVGPETPTDEALATIRGALAGCLGDLELRVQVEAHQGQGDLAAAVASDPRAGLGRSSLEEACEAPFQITIPPLAALDPRTLADLHELALGEDAGALHVTVPGAAPQDAMIEVVATSAWRRANRLGGATGEAPEQIIGRLFGERWVSGVEVSTRRHGVAEPQVTEHGPLAAATDLDHERNAHLRFRDRADDLAERSATLGRRTLAERLRARRERQAAERVESRLHQ